MSKTSTFLFAFLGAICLPGKAVAGQADTLWTANGVVVSSATGDQLNPAVVSDGAGGIIVVYESDAIGYQQIKAQRLSASGDKLWGDTSVTVSTITTDSVDPSVLQDGEGGAFIVWSHGADIYPNDMDIFAARVNSSGNVIWRKVINGESNVDYPIQGSPQIISDGAGGAIVTWKDMGKNPAIGHPYGQRIDSNGELLWASMGIPFSSIPGALKYAAPDGFGGAFVTYYSAGSYTQHINTDGTVLWGPNGITICDNASCSGAHILPENTGGFLTVWIDTRRGTTGTDPDLYGQKIDSQGNILWADNGIALASPTVDSVYGVFTTISDNQGGFLTYVYDFRSGVDDDIYGYRFDGNGNSLWISTGIAVATGPHHQDPWSSVSDGLGGSICSWVSRGVGDDNVYGVFAQRLNHKGQEQWTHNGETVSNVTGNWTGNKPRAEAISDNNHGAFIVWEDKRNGNWDIYAQHIREATVYPKPIANLTATAIEGRKIRLDWETSLSANASKYNIYYDSGTGIVNYFSTYSYVNHPATTWTFPPLQEGITYTFGVRTEDDQGVEECNFNMVVSATALDTLPVTVKAAIKVPQTGRKVSGNRVTVVAEIIEGTISQVRQVLFQYKPMISSTWANIPAATANHPNPDSTFPYFIHWDVTGIPEGEYSLRAVATSRSGVADPSPTSIVITVDRADPDIEEAIQGGCLQKREKITNSRTNIVQAGIDDGNALTSVTLPSNSLSQSTATLRIVTNPSGVPSLPNNLTPSGIVQEIELEHGQTNLSNGKIATITIAYSDTNDDGYIDGTMVRVDKVAVYVYDSTSGQWVQESATSVDTTNKTITCQTSHFSFFGLFAPAAANLSDVLVYPVPFVPNDGNTDNGKPYNGADPDSGIIFDNLTQSVKVQVFTITGELVWEKVTNTSSGKIQWDVRNMSGKDVASGGYFAVITDTAIGTKVVRKLAVIQ